MWQIFIDVSGQAPSNIYIGLLLVDASRKAEIITDFYPKFPRLKKYERKSIHVDEDTLFEVLKFFDSKGIRMACYQLKDFQWKRYERQLNCLFKAVNPHHIYRSNFYKFTEKIMGIAYFYALQQIVLDKNHHYEVIACAESNIDIWEVFKTIQKLSKYYGYRFNPNANIRKIEHFLKLADLVAGANRKLEEFKLNTIERHFLLNHPVRDYDLKKIFNVFNRKKKVGCAPHPRKNL